MRLWTACSTAPRPSPRLTDVAGTPKSEVFRTMPEALKPRAIDIEPKSEVFRMMPEVFKPRAIEIEPKSNVGTPK
jgi:hypothetical protein